MDRGPHLVVAGAHADDAEIGAAGTIARLVEERPDLIVTWIVLAAPDPTRADEARSSAKRLLERAAQLEIAIGDLRDGYLPYLGTTVKERLAAHADLSPDLVIGPRRDDAHQDHRHVAEILPQVFRGTTILEYEIPKWDGDIGTANVYVPLTSAEADAKVAHLNAVFGSQATRTWFDDATFRAVLRLRGVECRAPQGLAEAFVCRRIVV